MKKGALNSVNQTFEFNHTSVLLKETIEGLNIKPDGIYVDGTLGGGGHAYAVCEKLSKQGRYIGIDQDADAVGAARQRLQKFSEQVIIQRDNYKNMISTVKELGFETVDGILLDLGVSSYQLDTPERGFSYRQDAPLDMRMDQRQQKTAKDIVNTYEEMDLYRIIRDYGEDKFAKNIAKHIVQMRKKESIETTSQLKKAVDAAIPAMINLLRDEGRLCIITFHSLEDRIVKECFRRNEHPCTCPPQFPICVCNKKPKGVQITKKPIVACEDELLKNPRAKSAKLRIFHRSLPKT